jgi:glycerophosphoryl diester phosphodiesterase
MYSRRSLPQAISHRGLRTSAPENSIPAFQAAIEAGAEGIELDVHATLDGIVVVHHDFEVMLGEERAPIRTLDWATISKLTLSGDTHIPTLDQTLEAVRGRCRVYVEIKPTGIESDVVRCLRRHEHYIDDYAVHSFDHRVVKHVFEMMPSLRTGILQVGYPIDSISAMRSAGASDLWQHADFVDERLVADVHSRQGHIVVWTPNDSPQWQRLAELGVDAICTDRIDAYIRWRNAESPSNE